MAQFNAGKTQMHDTLKAKSEMRQAMVQSNEN
jgi:hypothetical protein